MDFHPKQQGQSLGASERKKAKKQKKKLVRPGRKSPDVA